MAKNGSQDLCFSLIKWLQTFDLKAPHRSAEEISDGVAMAEALGQISPDWFNSAFMAKIKPDVGSNWRLKVSNLKKIVEYIIDYYQECLNQQLSNFSKPDVAKIGEYGDRTELGRLLQLLLGCAVNCAHKQAYITVIMEMEESVQRVIMQAIQELESGSQLSIGLTEDLPMQRLSADFDRLTEERDKMAQRCHELDLQVSLLQDEKVGLVQEISKLQERLQEAESPASAGVSSSKYGLLRRELDSLKEEMFKVECARDDARARLETQDSIIADLQARVEELQTLADEARLLKDEMDVLRETADKAGKYEATIESYKRKLEELSDLKRQCKLLEDKNAGFVQINLDLEEELKRQGAWKSQAEAYKKQISELIQKQKEETNRADKLFFENNKALEKIAALTRDKERLMLERNDLREANEELRCEVSAKPGSHGISETGIDELQTDIRERLARLTQENRQLKLQQQDVNEVPTLRALLEASKEQVESLTQDFRNANKRVLELESQLEEMQCRNPESENDNVVAVNSLRSQIRTLSAELERLRTKSEVQEEHIEDLQGRNTQLKDALTRKESELAAGEEKFKKCLEKAKAVISSLEPNQNREIAALRNQALEKNNAIQRLEQDPNQSGAIDECQLLKIAFHHLSSQRQRDSVDNRLAFLSSGRSFLGRQRAPVARKGPNANK